MAYPKRPLEFYGLPAVSPPSEEMRRALAEQDCPFRERRCIKVRKSEPGQTIGACVVGFQGAAILICPHRMTDGGTIFRNAALLLSDDAQRRGRIRVVPEVTMPGGSIDYFIVAFGNRGEILDFVGLEIQTLDTTATKGVWDCRVDLAAGRRLATRYEYGMNWKMTAKTILVQILHKAGTFEMLGKKLVLTIQREFFRYLQENFRFEHVREAQDADPVHFHVYDLKPRENQRAGLVLVDRYSVPAAAIPEIIHGSDESVTLEEAERRIGAKARAAFDLPA